MNIFKAVKKEDKKLKAEDSKEVKKKEFSVEEKNNAKNAKLIFFVLFFVLLLILFSGIFGSSRKNSEDLNLEKSMEAMADEDLEDFSNDQNESCYDELDEGLGDFWVEINTDDLQIKSKILEGVSDDELAQGVGHHTTTAFPNNEIGNVVISGHRWIPEDVPAATVFIDLDKLKVNDEVDLCYENEKFTYKITGQKVIQDTEVSILEQTENPTITIYTCAPKYPLITPTKRLVYFGELVKE